MDLLTTRQVAAMLDPPVDVSTISRWVQLGKVTPAVRLPGSGQMLFDPEEVERLAAVWTASQSCRAS
jgi:hypothetical protein